MAFIQISGWLYWAEAANVWLGRPPASKFPEQPRAAFSRIKISLTRDDCEPKRKRKKKDTIGSFPRCISTMHMHKMYAIFNSKIPPPLPPSPKPSIHHHPSMSASLPNPTISASISPAPTQKRQPITLYKRRHLHECPFLVLATSYARSMLEKAEYTICGIASSAWTYV